MHLLLGEINVKVEHKIKLAKSPQYMWNWLGHSWNTEVYF